MGSEFFVYLRLGFEHIADPRGYDHILFIVALTAMYTPAAWRQVVALVTAFTVGHSVTLALATLGLIRVPGNLIELLIPLTILATAVLNGVEVWHGAPTAPAAGTARPMAAAVGDSAKEPRDAVTLTRRDRLTRYALALTFGLIHGLGFSNFLRAVLGAEASIVWPLFSFNVGLEIGQIFIVVLVLLATAIATGLLRAPQRAWVAALSATSGAVALYLVWQRMPPT
ncbi:MAG: HupE/UreJ family protein [Acidobacteriota bacterium]|jgi:hypothetical protein